MVGFGKALNWDPSQMITCHPKKIPKFLLKGGVVQFYRNIKNICKYKSVQVPTDLTVSSSSSSAARAQNGLQAENRFSCWLLPSSIIVLATIIIIPSVIHILIIRRLADYFADHNYHYYHALLLSIIPTIRRLAQQVALLEIEGRKASARAEAESREMVSFGICWNILRYYEIFWVIQRYSERWWLLIYVEIFWYIMRYLEILWNI